MIEFAIYLNNTYYDGEPLYKESWREFFLIEKGVYHSLGTL